MMDSHLDMLGYRVDMGLPNLCGIASRHRRGVRGLEDCVEGLR
jgi:hypothetical protein